MPTTIFSTLDQNRLGANLALSQGNLVVNASAICDIHRSVFGTLPLASGIGCFETQFYSNSQPSAGLSNLCSVGVAAVNSSTAKYVGEQTTSWGYRPFEAAIYNNNAVISGAVSPAIQPIAERQVIGVAINNTVSPPVCVWQVNGNPIFQANLTAGLFYLPAVSIGATVAGDVSAYCNFGQFLLSFPVFTFNL